MDRFCSCANLLHLVLQLCPPTCPLAFTSSSVCLLLCYPDYVAFLISAYPLTLSTLSHHLSVNLPTTFFLKPISWFTLSPFHLPLALFPPLSCFQLCVWPLWGVNLYSLPLFPPSSIPIILALTPSISVGPPTLSPLPPCMCIILPVPLYFIIAYLLNLTTIRLFHSLAISIIFLHASFPFNFLLWLALTVCVLFSIMRNPSCLSLQFLFPAPPCMMLIYHTEESYFTLVATVRPNSMA